jgi:hypothetical protein
MLQLTNTSSLFFPYVFVCALGCCRILLNLDQYSSIRLCLEMLKFHQQLKSLIRSVFSECHEVSWAARVKIALTLDNSSLFGAFSSVSVSVSSACTVIIKVEFMAQSNY